MKYLMPISFIALLKFQISNCWIDLVIKINISSWTSSCQYDLWVLSYLFSHSWHFHICFLHFYNFLKPNFYSFTCSIFTLRSIFFNLPSKFKLHFSFSTCSAFTLRFKFLLDTLVLNSTTLRTRIFKKDLNSFIMFVDSEDILEKECRIQRRELVFNFLWVWPNNLFLCLFFWQKCKMHKIKGNLQRFLLWMANKCVC